MANLTIQTCDECRKEARRLLKIDNHLYCSRDCYLTACKRLFDSMWFQELKKQSESVPPKQQPLSIVA